MKQHVLKTLRTELERTHDLVHHYKTSGIKEWFFSVFWNSFKRILEIYANEKEEVLMAYATLHYDIEKDIKSPESTMQDVDHIRIWITAMTYKIESCSEKLQDLISHSHRQEEILHHEKLFFVNLIESFNSDLADWVWSHEKALFWETTNIEDGTGKNSLETWKIRLSKQKQKLQSHIENIPKK